jgi:hypothetical protein
MLMPKWGGSLKAGRPWGWSSFWGGEPRHRQAIPKAGGFEDATRYFLIIYHRHNSSSLVEDYFLLAESGDGLSATTGALCSGVVRPGGNSTIRMLRKWIGAPSDSRQI